MSAFINNDITTDGLRVLARGQTGSPILFTKIVLGDGHLPQGQQVRDLTAVVHPVIELQITKCTATAEGTAVVGGTFDNGDIGDGLYYRELALFAEDPDNAGSEVLYCYGNAGDLAEYIPAGGGTTVVEKTIDIVAAIGSATNISAVIDTDAWATIAQVNSAISIAQQALAAAQTAESNSENAMTNAAAAINSIPTLQAQIEYNAGRIQILWDAIFSDITTNPFNVTFSDLEGITLTSGVWNATSQRLEC